MTLYGIATISPAAIGTLTMPPSGSAPLHDGLASHVSRVLLSDALSGAPSGMYPEDTSLSSSEALSSAVKQLPDQPVPWHEEQESARIEATSVFAPHPLFVAASG
jgi:hypothetical protein